MLEPLDARTAASIDPDFSAARTYMLDNALSGLKVIGHDNTTEEDFVIPLIPEGASKTMEPPIWNEEALLRRRAYNRKRIVLDICVATATLLALTGLVALLLKGVD